MNSKFKTYLQPAFLICIGVLAASTLSMQYIINKLDRVLEKDPIYLVHPFDELREDSISPYKVIRRDEITNLDVLESLGTEDYIQWLLEDTSVHENSPTRFSSLFITYYTGINDRIPHVPEECYFGAGSVRESMDDIKFTLEIPDSPMSEDGKLTIPARHLVFTKPSGNIWQVNPRFSVIYFLNVNNKYAGNRTQARARLAENLTGQFSFFSKVEWRFFGQSGTATPEEAREASKKLLETIVPVLEKEHWPNIEEAEAKLEDQE